MLESITKHPAGRFQRCRNCNAEPRHVRVACRSSKEPVQFAPVGIRHRIECSCGGRTSVHSTLAQAEAQWGTDYAQHALPFRVARRRKVTLPAKHDRGGWLAVCIGLSFVASAVFRASGVV